MELASEFPRSVMRIQRKAVGS
ncbi:hypothetical protein CURTO8I2_130081 [Curtobacterium sp. 8I-2]|nr:hypothetical protein CURTO8I2_130081 [Curtobacterium sp. 8I-2]